MDIWITVRIKLKWLYSAVTATKQQAIRDHDMAAKESAKEDSNPVRAQVYHAQGDAQWEASKGLEEVQQKVENDRDSG